MIFVYIKKKELLKIIYNKNVELKISYNNKILIIKNFTGISK